MNPLVPLGLASTGLVATLALWAFGHAPGGLVLVLALGVVALFVAYIPLR